jgi:amino acid adenylation domain-containing protein
MTATATGSDRFPLTDIQAAYIVGKTRLIELGGRQQYYLELDAVGLDPARAEQAMNQLLERHEHLRTVMSEEGYQRVMPTGDTPRVPIQVDDLTALDPDRRQDALRRTRERMCDQGLDPTGWPLFEVVVSRLRAHRSRVHLRASLLLLDAPGIRTVITEWWDLYLRPDVELPAVPMTFRQWRLALLEHERSEAYQAQWRYWADRLDTLPEAPQLPLARRPASIRAVRFTGRTGVLTRQEWERFCENFRAHRVLPTTALIHVYAEVIGAWATSPHFCLNVVHLNQAARHGGRQNVVGQRTATLPLEVDLRGQGGFWERAQALQRQLWRDMNNSDVTAVRISRELAARRGWSPRATLPYVFTSNQGPGWDSLTSRGRPVFRFLGRIQHTPQVLVDDQVRDAPDGGIASNLDFVDEAFPTGLPDLMAETYQRLLRRLAAPDGAASVPDLVSDEHRALIAASNDTAAPVPGGRLEDGFLWAAEADPDRPAVMTSGRVLSYGELEARSRGVAGWLAAHGIGRGDVVAIVMAKGWEQVVAVLGVLRAGAAYCPVDAGTPPQPMREMLAECRVRVALVQTGGPRLAADQPLEVLDVTAAAAAEGTVPPPVAPGEPTDLAYIIYTSGSTGRAKGVAIEHRGALNTVLDMNARLDLGPADRVFGISSLSFDLSVWDVFGVLAAGAALVLPDATARPDPLAWVGTAAAHGITIWNSVPALTEMLVEVAEQRTEVGRPPVRAFLLSGDWIPTSLPDRLRLLWPDAQLLALGGATEASIWSNVYVVDEVDPHWSSIPYGHPLTNQTMRVLDHRLQVRPPWAVGQIHIGGVGLAREYWNDPERTAERFITHPETGERLYRTGDLGRYWPDGTIELLGREDRQLKILGFRVEPGAIETAARSHPAVHECVVCPDESPNGQRRLVLLVVPRPGEHPEPAALTAHLRTLLPYYMVPAQAHVVDELPLTSNGKVDVARALASVASAGGEPAGDLGDQPGAGHLHKQLGAIWAELLQLPSIDPDANFFALGGNSLLALRMVNQVHAELGADLPLGQVFEAPTLRQLARCLTDRDGVVSCAVQLSATPEGEELVLFHVLGGSVAPYVPLAEGWPGPVRGFQSRGLVDRADAALPADMAAMAADYLAELRRHRPHGPYILGGWSMGGFLAYEAARQLATDGERAYVLMIDSDIPEITLPDTEAGRHIAFLINLTLGPPPEAAVAAINAAEPGTEEAVAREAAVAHGLLPAEVGLAGYRRLLRIHENDLRLVAGWQPGPLAVPALLMVADEEQDRVDPVPYWQARCPHIEVVRVPGDHFTVGAGDRLTELARLGARWLADQRADDRGPHPTRQVGTSSGDARIPMMSSIPTYRGESSEPQQ